MRACAHLPGSRPRALHANRPVPSPAVNTTGFQKMAAAWHRGLLGATAFRRATAPQHTPARAALPTGRRGATDAVPLTSHAGQARLSRQPELAPVWRLLPSLETQVTQSLCSVATAATILNSMPGVPSPVGQFYAPHAYFTQYNVLGPCAAQRPAQLRRNDHGDTLSGNLTAAWVSTHGASVEEQASFVSCFADAQAVHAALSTVDELRSTARELTQGGTLLAANFHRPSLGQEGGGHFSPIAAYDEESDSALLLDVARYKYPSFWFPLQALYDAMNTTDGSAGVSRGWVRVRPHTQGHSPPLPPLPPPAPPPNFAKIGDCVQALNPMDAPRIFTCFAEPS